MAASGVSAAANWWQAGGATNVLAAYQPKGAASLAASYTDLSSNGNDAAPGTAPTWNATDGWIFNGTTQYLDTGVVIANSGYTVIARVSDWSGFGGAAFGGDTFGGDFYLQLQQAGGSIIWRNGGQVSEATGTVTDSVLAIAGLTPYRDGTAKTAMATGIGSATNSLYIGARHIDGGGAGSFLPGYIKALAIYSSTQGAGVIGALTTAMAAL